MCDLYPPRKGREWRGRSEWDSIVREQIRSKHEGIHTFAHPASSDAAEVVERLAAPWSKSAWRDV